MQPTEFTVPKRALDVEDYIDVLRRHKGWIFGPFLLVLVVSVVGVYLWPDQYTSEATIQVKPQVVPQSLVQSVVNQDLLDEIATMQNTIMSRTVLTSIILNYDLYKRELASMPNEEVIDIMRRNIKIDTVAQSISSNGSRSVAAFSISFTYSNKYDARKVVQDLVGKFISQHTTDRSEKTIQTRQLLQDEVDRAREELTEKGNMLTRFRTVNAGRLPDQLNANTQQLMTAGQNLAMLQNAISRSQADKEMAQTQVRLLEEGIESIKREVPVEPPPVVSLRMRDMNAEIDQVERLLQITRQKYTENNPDVKDLNARLVQLRKNRDNLIAEEADDAAAANSKKVAPGLSASIRRDMQETNARIEMLKTQISQKDVEIRDYREELNKMSKRIGDYEGRVNSIPVGEQEYATLLREELLAREKYQLRQEALQKAQIASEMEGRSQGESLAVLDAASLPNEVSDPNRPLVISGGAAFGLLLGVVIAGAREMKDASLKNLKDVRVYTQMAILGSVPLLENDFVVRRRKRLAWLGWTVACLCAGLVMAGAIVYYYVTLPVVG